ncbi:hypothetical protein HO133_007077 [Letharia lupina]|uniref:Uncharacterized protein n=1 Tax=Letharia lupina TaxID=560253 RepID=A0A8H6FI55_9LECA|nr:uncharacterized protein HO133_007077 [Letharia lupina]KAF6228965.1 hypothetical protein HO133_007077 [Letharia lupina]
MVQRRKQLKPSGPERDRPEANLFLRSCPDTKSPLVALPAEIHGIITSLLVQSRDLNHLCCTCKTLSAVVLPTLYHTIELKIPQQWSRLPSLENLLASSSEGLKYTRSLRIVPRQYRQDVVENEHEFGDEEESVAETEVDDAEEEEDGEEDDGLFRVYRPRTSASNALNAFIRVLIAKLPPQQLHTFWWEHDCPLNTLTLSIVLKHQATSLRTLNLRDYTGNWRKADLAKLTMGGLTTLGIDELGRGDSWAIELLARNYQELRKLRLGSEMDLVTEYAEDGCLDSNEDGRFQLTENFAELLKDKVAALNGPSTPVVRLDSLSLVGLNLFYFAKGWIEPVNDFTSLSMLTLESCACVEAAFPLLMAVEAGRRKAKSALRLHTFAIRHENTSDEFLQGLESFLLSLKPLTNLHVLLEGCYERDIEMGKVLKLHGKCLRSLVWQQRTRPRSNMLADTSLFPDDYEELKLVAKYCTGLKALGISLDWADIARSEDSHEEIASSFSQLSQLQTLNIRNLPAASTSRTWLPTDYMMEGLATMLLNIVTNKTRIEQGPVLKTLAIGASTYGSVRGAMSHYSPNSASTFLQLRIYHVNYDCRYRDLISPKLHLIARGTAADAWGNAENLDIFALYWLDGAPQDARTRF